jgi:hypothetical protein
VRTVDWNIVPVSVRAYVSHAQARIRMAASLAFLGSLLFLVKGRIEPTGTLTGGHTDHIAHIGETRVFPSIGLSLWSAPAERLFRRLRPDEIAVLPADVQAHTLNNPANTHVVPGYPASRPLVMNFAHLPRCYPPGVFLVSAPSALLYHFGLVSFGAANRLFLAILMIAWLAAVAAWTSAWRELAPSSARKVATVAAAAYLWYWSIEGFYDVCAIALASLAIEAARRRSLGISCLLWGLAMTIHSRLLALSPLCLFAFVDTARSFRLLARKERIAAALAICLVTGAFAFAFLIRHTVRLHAASQPELRNILRPGSGPVLIVFLYAVLVAGLGISLYRAKEKRDAFVLVFLAAAFAAQPYLTPWYWMLALPWAMVTYAEQNPSAGYRIRAVARVAITGIFYIASLAAKW